MANEYNPRRKHGKYHEYTEEEIKREEERFFRRGGEITELPEQVTPRRMILMKYASCEATDEVVW